MSVTLLPPDLRRIFTDLQRRVGILERRVSIAITTATAGGEIIFSFAGELAASTSPPIRVRQAGIMSVLAVTLGTAGSSSTTILVERNGSTVGTVVVPSSTTVYNAEVGARYAADSDIVTLTIDTAGTGAADMTAAARFT